MTKNPLDYHQFPLVNQGQALLALGLVALLANTHLGGSFLAKSLADLKLKMRQQA